MHENCNWCDDRNPPKSEALFPARVVDPCNNAELGVTQGRLWFMKKSKLFVAKSLVNVQRSVIPLKMLNPTDKPRTVYKDIIAAWCEPMDQVIQPSESGSKSVDKKSWSVKR